jgi:hypothetical protein
MPANKILPKKQIPAHVCAGKKSPQENITCRVFSDCSAKAQAGLTYKK